MGSYSVLDYTRLIDPRSSALLRKKSSSMPSSGSLLLPSILVDEEISPVYDSKYLYLVNLGEVLANRYQTMVKLVRIYLRQYGSRVIYKSGI